MNPAPERTEADREKHRVASISVAAAALITAAKLAVGLWTNSLGILSEAAHSGLDLVAAAMTLWAVSVSGRPPDSGHTYGHGKAENLSALFETLLLLVTCGWIVWEAGDRLFFRQAHVSVNAWSFAVVALSIGVDYWRSRALKRAADKYRSQALEADALHFSTDIWSSAVVLVGLVGVLAASSLGWPWLARADAVAALGVALIVILVSYRLGRKSVDDLLDAAPAGLPETVAAAARVEGVREVRQVRVRRSGPSFFADVVVAVGPDSHLERAHAIADAAEESIRAALPGADVVVHVEPGAAEADPLALARAVAARHELAAHNLRVAEDDGGRSLDLHVEVPAALSLEAAHRRVSAFESDLRRRLPGLRAIVTHIEPVEDDDLAGKTDDAAERLLRQALESFQAAEGVALSPHKISVRSCAGQLSASLHCYLPPATPVKQAHDLTVRLERHLRAAQPDLGRVVIHVEPSGDPD
ncbi:MAG: cation-efflux pump [Elusimicrobia bacterium]|nr:cation-efflux pump [Elusimicrobiota bacterium]